jgi:hypothetical protein
MESLDLSQLTDEELPNEEDALESNIEAPVKKKAFTKNGKHVYGSRNPNSVVEDRCKRLYKRQLEGLPTRHLVLEHVERESIALSTGWKDWAIVQKWNTDDWSKERESMVSRIQGVRMRIVNQAIKKGQLMTAVTALQHIGAHLGEVDMSHSIALTPVLNITVEESRPKNLSSGAEPVNITPRIVEETEILSIEVDDI